MLLIVFVFLTGCRGYELDARRHTREIILYAELKNGAVKRIEKQLDMLLKEMENKMFRMDRIDLETNKMFRMDRIDLETNRGLELIEDENLDYIG
jgi:hypothetical protein